MKYLVTIRVRKNKGWLINWFFFLIESFWEKKVESDKTIPKLTSEIMDFIDNNL